MKMGGGEWSWKEFIALLTALVGLIGAAIGLYAKRSDTKPVPTPSMSQQVIVNPPPPITVPMTKGGGGADKSPPSSDPLRRHIPVAAMPSSTERSSAALSPQEVNIIHSPDFENADMMVDGKLGHVVSSTMNVTVIELEPGFHQLRTSIPGKFCAASFRVPTSGVVSLQCHAAAGEATQ